MAKKWQETYEERKTTAAEAMKNIRAGHPIFISTGCAKPQHLVNALKKYSLNLSDNTIFNLVDMGVMPFDNPAVFSSNFRVNSFFIGPSARDAVSEGNADYTPVFLSELPQIIRNRRFPIDVALLQLSPPDEHGYLSLGISVDVCKAAVESSRFVIAQVNPNMPRTLGDSIVHVNDIDAIVEYEEPLLEYDPVYSDHVAKEIGKHVAKLVEDGATLQIGIGAIPDAVLKSLEGKKDLGVHTEMFSDGIVDLVEKGIITNRKKSFHKDKIIASFVMGTRRVYDFVDNNALVEFHPTDYTSSPLNVSKNLKMTAINSALEVDLSGQVCADSLGYRFFSGLGGQADFVRGAAMAPEGKSVIALPSTAKNGTISRIKMFLSEGAGVVTTRGDVQYVVTEYGIAHLHGKNIRERALALINIAHPKFRKELLEQAKKYKYVYPDQEIPLEGEALYPDHLETIFKTKDGEEIRFRPIRPTDERGWQDFLYQQPGRDIYLRFMGIKKSFPRKMAQPLVNIDYFEKMAIIGVVGDEGEEEIVAIGRYFLDRATNMAEVAFIVGAKWQGKGIGRFLFNYLVEIAQKQGIKGFTASVLAENRKMLNLFQTSGYLVKSYLEEGVHELMFDFSTKKK